MNRQSLTAVATALALALLAGCASSSGGNNGTSCTPGESLPCTGTGSCSGTQTCTVEGNGYGACVCKEGGDAGMTTMEDSGISGFDSTVADTGTFNPDTGISSEDTGIATSDTGTVLSDTGMSSTDTGALSDGSMPTDTGTTVNDASNDTTTGMMCPDNTTFTALTWAPPTALHQGACSATQINAWVTSQDPTTGLGTSGNAACDACLVTPVTASAHGPVVTVTQNGMTFGAELNLGGCVADEDGSKNAGSCGNKVNNENDCIIQECGDCSDFNSTTQSSNGPTATCEDTIFGMGGVCASDLIANGSACDTEISADGGADQACLSAATLQDFFTTWCGGTPVMDGGHDAQTDGSHESGADASLTCPPQSTSGFTTGAYVAATAHQGKCNTSQINAFITACGDNGTAATCDAWQDANVAGDNDGGGAGTNCGNCIFAPQNNGATWTDPDGFFEPNYGACIQLTDTTHGTSCATALDNASGCEGVACDNACPANDSNPADFEACINAADNGSCSTYATTEGSACTTDFADGGAVNTCSPGAASDTLNPDFQYITTLICGQ